MNKMAFDELVTHFVDDYRKQQEFIAELYESTLTMGARLDQAYKDYVAKFGSPPLTDEQKKQAWLNYLLKEQRTPQADEDEPEPLPPNIPWV